MTPAEVIVSATRYPAEFFGMQDSLGTIAEGKVADLVLLDADPLFDIRNTTRIRGVVANGRYLDRGSLDALLSGAAALGDRKPRGTPASKLPRGPVREPPRQPLGKSTIGFLPRRMMRLDPSPREARARLTSRIGCQSLLRYYTRSRFWSAERRSVSTRSWWSRHGPSGSFALWMIGASAGDQRSGVAYRGDTNARWLGGRHTYCL